MKKMVHNVHILCKALYAICTCIHKFCISFAPKRKSKRKMFSLRTPSQVLTFIPSDSLSIHLYLMNLYLTKIFASDTTPIVEH